VTRIHACAVACIVGACGSRQVPSPRPAETPLATASVPDASAGPEGGDNVPSLRDLALRAPEVAPEMRVLAQGEAAPPSSVALPKASVDLCVRVVFAAGHAVRAKLETAEDGTLAEVGPVDAGVLGLRGPVCVRKGREVTLTFGEGATRVRYIVWGSP
jgi:hypothetical protein